MARRSSRRRSSRRSRERDYDDDYGGGRGRGGRGGGRGGGGGGGVPVPAIVGGVGLVVLVLIAFMASGGSSSGPGSSKAKKAAKAYLDAWKSGAVDAIVGMESLPKDKAERLVDRYKRRHDSATSGVRHAKDIRGNVGRDQSALFEMDDEVVQWSDSDKVAVARRVLTIAYKAFFSSEVKMSYKIKRVSTDGNTATVKVSISCDTGKDCPELVPLEDFIRNKEIRLVKSKSGWRVSRSFN